MRLTLTLGLRLLALAMFTSTATYAQTKVQPGSAGNQITFTAAGDISLDGGQCFGGVTSPPAGAVSVYGGKATAKDGNLYFQGAITWSSLVFPDGTTVRSGGTTLASMTNAGALYLKGKCLNVAGCRNTTWEPSRWNDGGAVQWNNNCYNYGNDKITGTFAQPGRASGNMYSSITVAEVRDGALSDGLTWVGWTFPGNTYDCGNGHLVFMAVAPGYDYHWWRLDQVKGVWSHKPGGTPAKNVDNSSNTITNPLLANRGAYTDNGGFYCTCGGMANIN